MIKSWSYSRLLDFEKCAYMAKLKIVERIPEPENKYSERGTRIHTAAEHYITGKTEVVAEELTSFTTEFAALRNLYDSGKVTVEQEWAYKNDWSTADWKSKDAWVRMKLDACVQLDKTTGVVIDFKSGKLFGNEIKHAEQGQLYAGMTFMRFPQLEKVVTEFWYTDQDELTSVVYKPQQAARFIVNFERRGRRMTEATEFRPNPSIFTCKWCAYRPESAGGNGACKFGVGNIGSAQDNARIYGRKKNSLI